MAQIKVEYDSHVGDCLKVCRMAKDSFGRTTDWEHVEAKDSDAATSLVESGWDIEHWDELSGIYQLRRLSDKDQRLLKMLARGMGQEEYESLQSDIVKAAEYPDYAEIERLIWKFRNTTPHLAPFGHNFITFKFQAPVFVMRQIVKHEYIRISELSMRYVRDMPEYYQPKSWRSVAEDVKQGSGCDMQEWMQDSLYAALQHAESDDSDNYSDDLAAGLAPEQARMFLRLCHMTQGHLSGSMDAIAGLVIKRLDPHAQEETREFARQIERQCREIWPWSWPALMEGVNVNT